MERMIIGGEPLTGKGILFMQKRLKNCGRKNRLYRKIKVTVLELTLKM